MMLIYQIDLERKNNFNINHKAISKSVLHVVEELLEEKNNSYNDVSTRTMQKLYIYFTRKEHYKRSFL